MLKGNVKCVINELLQICMVDTVIFNVMQQLPYLSTINKVYVSLVDKDYFNYVIIILKNPIWLIDNQASQK